MKWIIGTFLVCAISASPLLSRQEPADKDKPKQEEPKPKQEEPKQQPQEKPKTNPDKQQPEPAKQPKAEENKQQKTDEKQQKADTKQQQKEQKDAEKNAKESEKQNKDTEKAPKDNHQPAGNVQQTERGQRSAEGPGGRGQRIPAEKFQSSFGREHHFRVQHLDDRHRFQYGGYWFEVAQPWPAGWSYDDDCYIEDDGGDYYLVDLIHPGIHILVIVV
jgi:cytoskeletal protein RodZ